MIIDLALNFVLSCTIFCSFALGQIVRSMQYLFGYIKDKDVFSGTLQKKRKEVTGMTEN